MTQAYLGRLRRSFASDRTYIHYRIRQMGGFLLGQVQPTEEQTRAVIRDHYENAGFQPPRVSILPSPRAVLEAISHLFPADLRRAGEHELDPLPVEFSTQAARSSAKVELCRCRLCVHHLGLATAIADAMAEVIEFSHNRVPALEHAKGAIGLSRRTRGRHWEQLLDGRTDLDTHVWWAVAFRGAIFVSQPPTAFVVSDGELHCPDGPALTFADGSCYHVLRGRPVPACLTDRDWLTVERAESLPTRELRALAFNQVGWDRVLAEKGGRVIDDSKDATWGRLLRIRDFRDPSHVLEAQCGTGRTVVIPVPLQAATVEEAQSLLHGGLDPEILRAGVRT